MAGGLQEYKCKQCGGALEFNGAVQKLVCPFCDSEFSVEDFDSPDENETLDFGDSTNSKDSSNKGLDEGESDIVEDSVVYVCKSCGGEIVTDSNTSATSCPFCGNPVVIKNNIAGLVKPSGIVPFTVEKESVEHQIKLYYKGKTLLPKEFKRDNLIEEIKGVYVPYWVFEAHTDGEAKFAATKVKQTRRKNETVTVTKIYELEREGSVDISNMPIVGSETLESDLLDTIEPFYVQDQKKFSSGYLVGYLAEKYTIESEDCLEEAKVKATNTLGQQLQGSIQGDWTTVNQVTCTADVELSKGKYVLLPIYLATTKWKDKVYVFAMNGQTGKFAGNLPIDKAKLASLSLATIAVTTLLGTIAQFLIWAIS